MNLEQELKTFVLFFTFFGTKLENVLIKGVRGVLTVPSR